MADRIEVYDEISGYIEQAPGPDGPTYFVRLGTERITPRAAGDLIVDPNVAAIDWDTGWLYPTLTNSWVNYGGAYHPARYRKALNVVTVEGLIKNGSSAGAIPFTLPVGYRPEYRIITTTLSGSNTTLRRYDITKVGNIVPSGSTGWFELYTTFWAAN